MSAFLLITVLLAAGAVLALALPLLSARSGDRPQPARRSAAAVAVLLPVAAFASYFWLSDWPWDDGSHAAAGTEQAAPELRQAVAGLEQRLSLAPDDVEGWKLLGRSKTVMGDYAGARDAYAQAYTRSGGQDPDALLGYAEAMAMNDERELDGRAGELFEQAARMAPDNPRALWYGGLVALRRDDLALARERWQALRSQELPPGLGEVLEMQLAELDRVLGPAAAAPAASAAAAAPAATGAPRIDISVAVAPALAGRVPAQATLFVIARRGDAGPPLAVVRRPLGGWPQQVTLTDKDTMLPGMSLAGDGPLQLVARISRSGLAAPASGDLYGEVGYDLSATRQVRLTIDRVVP